MLSFLMQKMQTFRGGGHYKKLAASNNLIISVAVFLACFALAFVAGSLVIQPQGTKAVTGLGLVGGDEISLTANVGTVELDITPSSTGTQVAGAQVLTAETNVPTGYNLSVSTPTAPSFTTTTGTLAAPTVLTNNTWGYALENAGGSSNLNTVVNGFDASYNIPTPNAASKWADPSVSTVIKNTANSTAVLPASADTTIYYGARVDLSSASGTYANTVRYTAAANLTALPSPNIISVTPNSGSTTGGTTIAIVGSGFVYNDQSLVRSVSIGAGSACANVSISSNTPVVGQDTITCDVPVHPVAGAVYVFVTTWRSQTVMTNGYTYLPPTPTITAPTANQVLAAGTTSTILTTTTDYAGTCYYGTGQYPTTAMSSTGGVSHSQTITGLTSGSSYQYFVRCQAAAGHSYNDHMSNDYTGHKFSVGFHVRSEVPAAPTLSPADGATVAIGATTITVSSATVGASCRWGTSNGYMINDSGTSYTVVVGTNTLYYYCGVGASVVRATIDGSWSFTGKQPLPYAGIIQTITTANCPTVMSRTNDARDDATYIVQKMADGRCWMLTNLAYGGGGTNTYGDVKTITNSNTQDFTQPYYMIPTGSNRTTGTADPSTSIDGGATDPQYGYLYNWCAAMGAQTATSACANASTPLPDQSISICPAGWRLPTGGGSGEFQTLTTAIGATGDAAGSTVLRSTWLAMYSGTWNNGFNYQGSTGYYWSSAQFNATNSYRLFFGSLNVYPPTSVYSKYNGYVVRCISS